MSQFFSFPPASTSAANSSGDSLPGRVSPVTSPRKTPHHSTIAAAFATTVADSNAKFLNEEGLAPRVGQAELPATHKADVPPSSPSALSAGSPSVKPADLPPTPAAAANNPPLNTAAVIPPAPTSPANWFSSQQPPLPPARPSGTSMTASTTTTNPAANDQNGCCARCVVM